MIAETDQGIGKSNEQIAATNKTVPKENESFTQEAPVVNRQHSYRPPVPQFSETQEEYAQRLAQEEGGVKGEREEDVQMNERNELERAETVTQRKQDRRVESQGGIVESQLLDCKQPILSIAISVACLDMVNLVSQRPGQPLNESNDTIINESSKKLDESAQKNQDTIQSIDTQSIGQGATLKARPARRTKRKVGEGEACECGEVPLCDPAFRAELMLNHSRRILR